MQYAAETIVKVTHLSKPDNKYYNGLFTFHVGRRISHKVCEYLQYYALRLAFQNSSLEHLRMFEEHLKTIWCVIAARSRYGIGRNDDESKLA